MASRRSPGHEVADLWLNGPCPERVFSFFNNDVLGSENSKNCLMVADGSSLLYIVLGFANFVRNKMPLPSKIMGDSSVDL